MSLRNAALFLPLLLVTWAPCPCVANGGVTITQTNILTKMGIGTLSNDLLIVNSTALSTGVGLLLGTIFLGAALYENNLLQNFFTVKSGLANGSLSLQVAEGRSGLLTTAQEPYFLSPTTPMPLADPAPSPPTTSASKPVASVPVYCAHYCDAHCRQHQSEYDYYWRKKRRVRRD